MDHPETGELLTLGRLALRGSSGELLYAPEWVKRGDWVPDPINYPLRAEPFTGIKKNRGVPGFINDAMPDGWGERLLHRAYGRDLGPIDFLLKSPNSDRIGNLMAGTAVAPLPGLGGEQFQLYEVWQSLFRPVKPFTTGSSKMRRLSRPIFVGSGQRSAVRARNEPCKTTEC